MYRILVKYQASIEVRCTITASLVHEYRKVMDDSDDATRVLHETSIVICT